MLTAFLRVLALAMLPAAAGSETLTIEGAGGVPLHTETAGDPEAPPILFLHGVGQSHFMFHRQFESSLAEDFFLVSFDLRGHGASGKPWTDAAYAPAAFASDVAAVLNGVGARRPLIVAWSYGTLVALDYLRAQGVGNASGLVMIGALGALLPVRMPPSDDAETAEFLRFRELQLSPRPRDQVAAAERMVDWLTAQPAPTAERDVLVATAMMFPGYARSAVYGYSRDNRDLLPALRGMPLLLALGEADNPLLLEDAERLTQRYDNIRFSRYADAGHSVFYERPQRFNRELRELASEVLGSEAATIRE